MTSPDQPFADLPLEVRARLERQLLQACASTESEHIRRRRTSGPCRLSFAQQRLWFLDQYDPGTHLYNIASAFRLQGDFNHAAAERALDTLVARHESLRTTFAIVDDEPVQRIAENISVPLPIDDLSRLPGDERSAEFDRLLSRELRQPFDLSRDCMLRPRLFRIDATEHVLVLATHHIASDGWSMEILFREFAALYSAFATGAAPALPDLPIQYADFSEWQRDWMQGDVLQGQVGYWKKQLAGMPALLGLPTDFPRPAVETFLGGRVSQSLSVELTRLLKRLSQQNGATLFMTLLGAFQLLLARYSGQRDIAVGMPVAGRNRLETEGLIGLFVNTLVLRTDTADDQTFRELLAQVRDVTLSALNHQDLPFEKLVEELQPERNLSHSPLYQVMFALQNAPRGSLELPGLTATAVPIDPGKSKFDLTVYLIEKDGGLQATAEYNSSLFRRETVERMLGHYRVLLEGIVEQPDRRISHLPLLSNAQRRQILVDWGQNGTGEQSGGCAAIDVVHANRCTVADTKTSSPCEGAPRIRGLAGDCFHRLFEAQAARTPDRVAVVFDGEQSTYRELNERANRLARHLQKLGVGPGRLVGHCLKRSTEMLVGVLAVAKAGGAYVPLDPDYPPARLQFMLEDSQARVLVTQTALQELFGAPAAQVVRVDADAAEIDSQSSTNPTSEVTTEHLAYVIYTSGSTGKPKGVEIPHAALSNFLESMRREPGLAEEDVVLAVTTLSFDIATLELFLPLVVGARAVLVDRETAVDGRRLHELLREHAATVMQATPATWKLLLHAGRLPDGLKVLCGGETLSPELATTLKQQAGQVWNMYGPTETTVWSTVEQIDSVETVLIGRPIDNTEVYVLDRNRQPIPAGVPGELYIGGQGLARGYLNRPKLTAEKFVPHPFRDDVHAKLYRTGDIARWHAHGRLECLGRVDDQIKIRGYRVELSEIETVLARDPQVGECAVTAREDDYGEKRLAAYIVPAGKGTIDSGSLRRRLAEELPDYMIPAAFTMLLSLPRLPNGKLDRNSLPDPAPNRRESERNYVAPRSPFEEILAKIWAEVLELDRVGVDDNFFELGGHSLLAMRVMSRVENAFQVNISVRMLFEAPTVAAFSHALLQAAMPRLVAHSD